MEGEQTRGRDLDEGGVNEVEDTDGMGGGMGEGKQGDEGPCGDEFFGGC